MQHAGQIAHTFPGEFQVISYLLSVDNGTGRAAGNYPLEAVVFGLQFNKIRLCHIGTLP